MGVCHFAFHNELLAYENNSESKFVQSLDFQAQEEVRRHSTWRKRLDLRQDQLCVQVELRQNV